METVEQSEVKDNIVEIMIWRHPLCCRHTQPTLNKTGCSHVNRMVLTSVSRKCGVMSRTEQSIGYYTRQQALDGVMGNTTRKTYRRASSRFADWCKSEGINKPSKVDRGVIQRYADSMVGKYAPDTVHTYLSPVCKAYGVSMQHIDKPKRVSADSTRGRTGTVRSDREMSDPRYKRSVDLQNSLGIRRRELTRLRGRDLVDRGTGGLWVVVEKGKGGKRQEQFVLPKDRETVREIFKGIGQDERVLQPSDMGTHINYHGIRASHSREAYNFWASRIQKPGMRENVVRALADSWRRGHAEDWKKDPARAEARLRGFLEKVQNPAPVRLRGDSKRLAESLGRPTEYDRLALFCVSVWHLAHWRLDVTVSRYMLGGGE